jgi:pyruvate kinase
MSTVPPRHTKIVATLGPAWESPERMSAMLEAGVDVVRINASHGDAATRERWIARVREVAGGRPVAVLLDLQGPRIRVGALAAPLALEPGQRVVFAPEGRAAAGQIPVTHAGLAADVRPGGRILLDDGLLEVTVESVRDDRVEGTVRHGGSLKANKGINLPGVDVSVPSLTDKDRDDLARAERAGVDYVAISFVRRAQDVEGVRALVPPGVRLVSKIEKDVALAQLPAIVHASDAIMVARGDLGVELPFEEVPLAQKRIIAESLRHGRPVITATQMLESMVRAPRPTRAEASDVANAILDGTDAVMLSAEAAVGEYPVEAVRAMDRIAREVERDPAATRLLALRSRLRRRREARPAAGAEGAVAADPPARTEDAVAAAVHAAAGLLDAPLIVVFTRSGFSARVIAATRPEQPILAVTPEPLTFRQLALVHGVVPLHRQQMPEAAAMLAGVREHVLASGLARAGDRVVVSAGMPFDVTGTTNLVKIETL